MSELPAYVKLNDVIAGSLGKQVYKFLTAGTVVGADGKRIPVAAGDSVSIPNNFQWSFEEVTCE